ncbi:MAG: hypothetical protein JWM33_2451 [Caulobacteraceae bacterium]|nr:hypothetical protein [Caulobacteraceae bacterium]
MTQVENRRARARARTGLLVLAACVLAGQAVCATVKTRETDSLKSRYDGRLLAIGRGMTVIDPADGGVVTFRPLGEQPALDFSGPDRAGRVAVYTYSRDALTYELRLRNPDGSEPILVGLRSPTGAEWPGTLSDIALAPEGGAIALVAHPPGNRLATFYSGALEYWDQSAQAMHDTGIVAAVQAPSWFPDSRRLAYVVLPKGPQRTRAAAGAMVHVLDIATGADSILTQGNYPVISDDGTTVLVQRGPSRFVRVTLADGKETVVPLGANVRAIAMLDRRDIIYTDAPTKGMPVEYELMGTPFATKHAMPVVKLMDADTGAFVTLAGPVSARHPRVTLVRRRRP